MGKKVRMGTSKIVPETGSKSLKDAAMISLWHALAKDLRSSLKLKHLGEKQQQALFKGIQPFREVNSPQVMHCKNTQLYKGVTQLSCLFKRYIFDDDCTQQSQLDEAACKAFISSQAEVSVMLPDSAVVHKVLQDARILIKDILGPYSREMHYDLCRFGRRAAVNLHSEDSYLFMRLRALSGSSKQWSWFNEYMNHDLTFPSHESKGVVKSLAVSSVPKSYAKGRTIAPDTVIGGFASLGLGVYIQNQLADNAGIDIRTQQSVHRSIIKRSSITRELVTMDMSKASDMIGFVHLRRLIPSDWLRVLRDIRIPEMGALGFKLRAQSFMTMGIGYTFPLQTLIYYALLISIMRNLERTGFVSVYGDDCIYPRFMHKYVLYVFRAIGFQINVDKTFATSFFRESCGADYFHGVDVRPCMPQTSNDETYEQFLYKLYNTLFSRWHQLELPTCDYLLKWLLMDIRGYLLQVPMSYSESTGIRVQTPLKSDSLVLWSPVEYRCTNDKRFGVYNYLEGAYFMSLVPARKHYVQDIPVDCYYWDSLRVASLSPEIDISLKKASLRHLALTLLSKDVELAVVGASYAHKNVKQEVVWRKFRRSKRDIQRDMNLSRKYISGTNCAKARARAAERLASLRVDLEVPCIAEKRAAGTRVGEACIAPHLWCLLTA